MFNRREILLSAWAMYRDMVKSWPRSCTPETLREDFRACLRAAWRDAKRVARYGANAERIAEIEGQIESEKYRDRMNWTLVGSLEAELATLQRLA